MELSWTFLEHILFYISFYISIFKSKVSKFEFRNCSVTAKEACDPDPVVNQFPAEDAELDGCIEELETTILSSDVNMTAFSVICF